MKKFFGYPKLLWLLLLQQFGRCVECGSWGPHDIATHHEIVCGVGFDGICASMPEDRTVRSTTCLCGHKLCDEVVRINGLMN